MVQSALEDEMASRDGALALSLRLPIFAEIILEERRHELALVRHELGLAKTETGPNRVVAEGISYFSQCLSEGRVSRQWIDSLLNRYDEALAAASATPTTIRVLPATMAAIEQRKHQLTLAAIESGLSRYSASYSRVISEALAWMAENPIPQHWSNAWLEEQRAVAK